MNLVSEKKIASGRSGIGECKADSAYNEQLQFFYTKSDEKMVEKLYMDDLKKAKKEIFMDIPKLPQDGKFLSDIAAEVKKKKKAKVRIQVRSESSDKILKPFDKLLDKNKNAKIPLTIIDNQVIWYGVPFTNGCFRSGKKDIKTKLYPMIRFEGENTAEMLKKMLKMVEE